MIVYGGCDFYDSQEKTFFVADYFGGLIYHFQNLDFGESVKEIVYHSVTSNTPFLNFLEEKDFKPKYGRRNKGIRTYSVFDSNIAQELTGLKLLSFISEHIMLETSKFSEFKIKKFDLDAYKIALRQYFDDALTLIKEGRNPSEGKILNEDIELIMQRKWANL